MCGTHLSECSFWKLMEKESGLNFKRITTAFNKTILAKCLVFLLPRCCGERVLKYLSFLPSIKQNNEVLKNIFTIYATIHNVTGKNILVDSSKGALAFKYYYLFHPEQIKVIFLYRDGKAVMNSLMKRGVDPEKAAKTWVKSVRNMERMGFMIPRSKILRVKYEELCRDPKREMQKMSHFLGIRFNHQQIFIRKSMKHNIGGSPTIKNQTKELINLSLDESWKYDLSANHIAIFNTIGSKLNKQLGYH